MSWSNRRPIHDRLPGYEGQYRKPEDWEDYDEASDPPVACWLVAPWDELLASSKDKLDAFYSTHLNPLTAEEENLDWLAQLAGFTGSYWGQGIPIAAKRLFIANAFTFIWPYKGTRILLELAFSSLGLGASIYQLGDALADFAQADITRIGTEEGSADKSYFILLPLQYLRTSVEWRSVERLDDLFSPVWAQRLIAYDHFYADFSAAGDPVMD